MTNLPQSCERSPRWSSESLALAAQARVLSGSKLEQLVIRLQRHSGRSREACWRFVIQYGLKGKSDHRRWAEDEIDLVREELVKCSVDEIAKKLNRTPASVRRMLGRNRLHIREIRCDLFSVESLARALHVRKTEIHFWIEQGWLRATINIQGKRTFHTITTESLLHLYKHHLNDLLKRGVPNHCLFDAYVQYCHSPKHTVGEQLLEVRRDKRERAAIEKIERGNHPEDESDEGEKKYYLGLNPNRAMNNGAANDSA
jgi:hypothetical protein